MNARKLLQKIAGKPNNTRFGELQTLAEYFGFLLVRVSGSHHIYEHISTGERINLQNVKGKAKPYQIRQLIKLIEQDNIQPEGDR